MKGLQRFVRLLALGFVLLVVQSAALGFLPFLSRVTPQIVLALVVYIGLERALPVTQGCGTAFALGWLLDSFTGYPLGLQTFVVVAGFLCARVAGARFVGRGWLFRTGITTLVALVAGGLTLALRAVFELQAESIGLSPLEATRVVVVTAIATGVCAPLVFLAAQRVDIGSGVVAVLPRLRY